MEVVNVFAFFGPCHAQTTDRKRERIMDAYLMDVPAADVAVFTARRDMSPLFPSPCWKIYTEKNTTLLHGRLTPDSMNEQMCPLSRPTAGQYVWGGIKQLWVVSICTGTPNGWECTENVIVHRCMCNYYNTWWSYCGFTSVCTTFNYTSTGLSWKCSVLFGHTTLLSEQKYVFT